MPDVIAVTDPAKVRGAATALAGRRGACTTACTTLDAAVSAVGAAATPQTPTVAAWGSALATLATATAAVKRSAGTADAAVTAAATSLTNIHTGFGEIDGAGDGRVWEC